MYIMGVFKKNKKKSGIYQFIYCDMYKQTVTVFIGGCEDLKIFAKKVYTEDNERDLIHTLEETCSEANYNDNNVGARCYNSDSGTIIVHLPEFSFEYNPIEIANLSHELLHATFLMLDFIGVEYRYGGANEPYTYLHEYLLKNALNKKNYKKV